MEILSLCDCGITSEFLLILAPSLKENHHLKQLMLRSNEIGNHGAAGLAQTLSTNESLVSIDMQRNKVKCQGAIALAAIFKVNKTLQSINFRFNEISDTGSSAIGSSLKLNASLIELDLGGNLYTSFSLLQSYNILELAMLAPRLLLKVLPKIKT